MQKIYLDMNIYEDYFTSRDVMIQESLKILQENDINFFYSPAHIEELAVILRREENKDKAIKYIYDRLVCISNLTQNFEFLPSYSSTIIKQEHPTICFKRVIDNYNTTLFAEENEKFIFSIKDQKTLEDYYKNDTIQGIETFDELQKRFNINKKKLNDVPPEKLFTLPEVLNSFECIMGDFGYSFSKIPKWKDIKHSHSKIEVTVGLLYNFLEKIGYKSEPIKKLRSRMHDVSHGIYGTASDILVTGDDRFYKKTKAIYNLLEAPTIVFNKAEFNTYAIYESGNNDNLSSLS